MQTHTHTGCALSQTSTGYRKSIRQQAQQSMRDTHLLNKLSCRAGLGVFGKLAPRLLLSGAEGERHVCGCKLQRWKVRAPIRKSRFLLSIFIYLLHASWKHKTFTPHRAAASTIFATRSKIASRCALIGAVVGRTLLCWITPTRTKLKSRKKRHI